MKKRVALLLLSFSAALFPLIFLFSQSLSAQDKGIVPSNSDKIGSLLLAEMAESNENILFRVIVDLYEQTDLTAVSSISSLAGRRYGTVAQLQNTAVSSQAALLQEIETLANNGEINSYRPFWIVNKIAAEGTEQAILALANQPDVAAVRLDAQVASINPPDDDDILTLLQTTITTTLNAVSSTTGNTWGIDRIRAPYVWDGLGIRGDGVTVAIMDSGVDFTHPDLVANYRGNLGGGNFEHNGNWYNTSTPTITVPTDFLGHGTHVAGTAVGQNGIGVAPGAKWIAVAITDEYGFIYESDVHAGFEWILAPNGDPGLAPDIVNNSWSGPGFTTTFYEDVLALHAAGIIPAFAAGNNGPFGGTVGAPASYTDTLAIGASDDLDGIAWFSSLGPSPLTDEIKPWVVAPGTQTFSSLPGGGYGYNSGTSMATPHVVGTMALILSANPTLSRNELLTILADTAVPLTSTRPTMVGGWGRIDAYAAVFPQVTTGELTGLVRDNGTPMPQITVTISAPSGGNLTFVTDENGRYRANLVTANYDLTINYFGFAPFASNNIAVQNGQTTTFDIDLARLPSGTIQGTVRSAETQQPLPNTKVYIPGAPASTMTDANGNYTLILPSDSYKLYGRLPQYRLQSANILIQTNAEATQDFYLTPTRSILIVDSGRWYFQSQASYYQNALTSLNYPYDTWTISHPFNSRPTLADLAPYDDVIWSAPLDSPGFIGAGTIISDYLGLGKNMLISGQNIGLYDGSGISTQWWWYSLLEARYAGNNAITQTIFGAPNTNYEGISLTLNGGDSAQNQGYADVATSRPGTLSEPNFYFADGYNAGLQSGACQSFRLSYLGFGLEGVSEATDRAAILEQSFAYFDSPRAQFGVQLTPTSVDDFAIPGQNLAYTLTVRNLSETLTDTFTLDTLGSSWVTALLTESLTLGPCQAGQTVLQISVPNDAPKDFEHTTQVTAVSQNNPSVQEYMLLEHKIPGQILFVDDDRWYDYEAKLTETLDNMGLTYDVWETGYNQKGRGSPSGAFLNAYDYVLWYTGYDWFAPILPSERDDLTQYLAQGGRLFLSSQDFLHHHSNSELAQSYFGVKDYWEYWGEVEPTAVFAGEHRAVDDALAGPATFDFSVYQNHTDALIPDNLDNVPFWYDRGYPAGTMTNGDDWRAAFLAYPLELISPTQRNLSMNRIMGWLTDFGDSAFIVDEQTAASGQARTYTITLRNAQIGLDDNPIMMTNTLPANLSINPATIVGGATYNPATQELTWQGMLGKGAEQVIWYEATPQDGLPTGTAVTNTLSIYTPRHNIQFDKVATIWIDAPELSYSVVTAVTNQPFAADTITYTFQLNNSGLTATNGVSSTMPFPDQYFVLTDTLSSSAGTAVLGDHRVYWTGDLNVNETITVSVAMTRSVTLSPQWIPTTGILHDGLTRSVITGDLWEIRPYGQYFPLITQNK